jgi:prepilin-type processing-associated H-X9-DG protein
MTKRAKFVLAGIGALLVVILMCAAGFAVLFVGLSNSRRTALKAQCGTHLKSLGTAYAVYAAANNDKLPSGVLPPGSWMCDENFPALATVASSLNSGGLNSASMAKWTYCPANAHQQPAPGASLFELTASAGMIGDSRHVMGYISTMDRPEMPPLTGLRAMPKLQYHTKMSIVQNANTTELLLDWIISDKPPAPEAAVTTWTGITAPPRPGIYDTSHLSGKIPAGANVLTFDGHVEWRPFNPANATPIPQTPGGPTFWIPNP